MRTRVALIVMLYVASATAASAEVLVRHAGEWETTIDNGQPRIVCFPTDVTMDQGSIMQSMAKLPGANCTISDFKTVGAVTSYSTQCTIGGSQMTSSGTITATGPDAFSTKAHSHGGVIKMPNGKEAAMPDIDMVTVSRRLGPCKPGDRQVTH
jgi:hypothetical protein